MNKLGTLGLVGLVGLSLNSCDNELAPEPKPWPDPIALEYTAPAVKILSYTLREGDTIKGINEAEFDSNPDDKFTYQQGKSYKNTGEDTHHDYGYLFKASVRSGGRNTSDTATLFDYNSLETIQMLNPKSASSHYTKSEIDTFPVGTQINLPDWDNDGLINGYAANDTGITIGHSATEQGGPCIAKEQTIRWSPKLTTITHTYTRPDDQK